MNGLRENYGVNEVKVATLPGERRIKKDRQCSKLGIVLQGGGGWGDTGPPFPTPKPWAHAVIRQVHLLNPKICLRVLPDSGLQAPTQGIRVTL